MVLTIGEKNYDIDTFVINFDIRVNQEAVQVSIKDVEDFQALSREIRQNYQDVFVITTRLSTYTFTDYELESIDMFVEETYNTVNIRFTKEA